MTKHLFHKKFSFPIHFQEVFKDKVKFLFFLKQHQSIINEIYFPPYMLNLDYDAHNGKHLTFTNEEVEEIHRFLNLVKKTTDIKFCAIFNDRFLNEEEENAKISEFEKYLENPVIPIDIIVVTSKKWLKFQKQNIVVKNSVVLLPTFDEIKQGLYNDYDVVYIHDDIIHNQKKYEELKKQTQLQLGVVVNFDWCRSNCPHKYQHYHDFKYLKEASQPRIDSYCPSIVGGNKDKNFLKDNRIPMFYSAYKKYVNTIDIFKLQGRRDKDAFHNAMQIVKNVFLEQEILDPTFYVPEKIKIKKHRKTWINKISNCGGDCNNCTFCDNFLKN